MLSERGGGMDLAQRHEMCCMRACLSGYRTVGALRTDRVLYHVACATQLIFQVQYSFFKPSPPVLTTILKTRLEGPSSPAVLTHTISHRSDPHKLKKKRANAKRATEGSGNHWFGFNRGMTCGVMETPPSPSLFVRSCSIFHFASD